MAFNSGAPKGELASSRPVMAASIITTAAFLSEFIVPKYSDFGNKEFTSGAVMKHFGNVQIHYLKHV
jgi:hypothetical protein